MRIIVHLSDLHFGRQDPRVAAPLLEVIASISPDLVVVSGDLTQRARRNDSSKAAGFSINCHFRS